MNNHSTDKNNNPAVRFLQGAQGIIASSLLYAFASFFVLLFVLTTTFFTYAIPAIITLLIMLIPFQIVCAVLIAGHTFMAVIMAMVFTCIAYFVFYVARLKSSQAYYAYMRGGE